MWVPNKLLKLTRNPALATKNEHNNSIKTFATSAANEVSFLQLTLWDARVGINEYRIFTLNGKNIAMLILAVSNVTHEHNSGRNLHINILLKKDLGYYSTLVN